MPTRKEQNRPEWKYQDMILQNQIKLQPSDMQFRDESPVVDSQPGNKAHADGPARSTHMNTQPCTMWKQIRFLLFHWWFFPNKLAPAIAKKPLADLSQFQVPSNIDHTFTIEKRCLWFSPRRCWPDPAHHLVPPSQLENMKTSAPTVCVLKNRSKMTWNACSVNEIS